jgi:anti-sigma regulatory factor (Ser/Thr protein kinase)
VFCGDILLVERSPTSALHVLVGDFTGHGLSAAIGALPAADVFRGMTAKGFTASEILAELNRKLRQTLPTGMFLAAVFVSINPDGQFAQIRNSGLPDVYILNQETGTIRLRIPSSSIPLGISSLLGSMDLQWIEVEPGEQVVVVTDGIVEARNSRGDFYGESRLEECLQRGLAREAYPRLIADLDEFVIGTIQEDDLTLAIIPCRAERTDSLTKALTQEFTLETDPAAFQNADWCWNIEMRHTLLKRTDTVPLLVSTLVDMQGLQAQRQILFTILAELFSNALEHGLLHLDSGLKSLTDGFAGYYRLRDERLAQLDNGWIRVSFQVKTQDRHGWLYIQVEDSGPGFDFEKWQANLGDVRKLSGRGMALVRELTYSMQYKEPGNVVEVVYLW